MFLNRNRNFFVFQLLLVPVLNKVVRLVENNDTPNRFKRTQLVLLGQFDIFVNLFRQKGVTFQVVLPFAITLELLLDFMQKRRVVHQLLHCDFVTRGIKQCLLKEGEFAELILSFTPKEQTKVIDQLNVVQVFISCPLLVVLLSQFFDQIVSGYVLTATSIFDHFVSPQLKLVIKLLIFCYGLQGQLWIEIVPEV